MKLHAAYWVTAGVLAVAGIVMMGCAFVQRANLREGRSWSDSFGGFDNIEMKAGYCTVKVEPIGADEECRVDFVNMPEDTEAYVEGNTLFIKEEKKNRFRFVSFGDFGWEQGEVTIYLPERDYKKIKMSVGVAAESVIDSLSCNTLVLDCGVGDLDLVNSRITGDLDIDSGTGDFTMREVTVEGKSDIDSGVGRMHMDRVQMQKKADIDVGTGDFDVTACEFAELEIDGGVGDVKFLSAKLSGDVDVTLGTGDIEIEVLGDPMLYSFNMDGSDVTINGDNVKVMNNYDAQYEFKADCGVGDISVTFLE